jgi:hypothetical protein
VAEGRRDTFEDSIRQKLRHFDREVDEKRQALGRLARERPDDLERISAAHREALEDAVALEQVGAAQLAAFEQTAREHLAAFEELLGRTEQAGRKTPRAGSWQRTAPPVTAVVLAVAAAIGGTMLLRDRGQDRSRAAPAPAPEAKLALPAYSSTLETTPPTSDAPPTNAAPSTDAAADLPPIHWRADQVPSPPQPTASSSANASVITAPAPPPITAAPLTQQAQPLPNGSTTSGSQNPRHPNNGRASQPSQSTRQR